MPFEGAVIYANDIILVLLCLTDSIILSMLNMYGVYTRQIDMLLYHEKEIIL